jgi:hypothetical protein
MTHFAFAMPLVWNSVECHSFLVDFLELILAPYLVVSFSLLNRRKFHNSQRICDTVDDLDCSVAFHGETNQQFPAAFRQWTAPAEGSTLQDAPIPGLREALGNAGLSSFIIATERWCQKNGAASLGEVADAVESLCCELGPPGSEGLTPELRERFFRTLSSQGTSELRRCSTPPDSIETFVADIRGKMSAAKSAQRAVFVGESDGHRVGLVPGLRNAFEQAGLSDLSDTAEAWCYDNGAVYLQEMIDDFDDLCENLNHPNSGYLDTQVCERLKQTLSSEIALHSGRLLGGNRRKAKSW